MTWQVAPAHLDDAPRLAEILSDWIDEADWMPRLHSRADDLAFVTGLVSTGRALTLFDETGAQGFLACRDDMMAALYVARDARNRGGGKALLDFAKRHHDRLGLWVFEANAEAVRFYRREGFVIDGRTPGNNAEQLPDIRMVWHRTEETSHDRA
jgi:GNAT superfamily N-acetyltransferase